MVDEALRANWPRKSRRDGFFLVPANEETRSGYEWAAIRRSPRHCGASILFHYGKLGPNTEAERVRFCYAIHWRRRLTVDADP